MTRLRYATAGIALPLLLACQTLVPPPSADPPAALAEEVLEPATAVIPDLTGTWSARLRSIYRGVGALGLGASEGADIDYLRLTIDIEIQDGRLFYGTFHSQAPGAEDAPPQEIFGAIRSNGETAIYVTAAGRGTMYFGSGEEIEVCGGRGDADVMLAFCSRMRRAASVETSSNENP